MGGAVVLHLALEQPELVESLVLVAPEGIPADGGYGSDGIFAQQAADVRARPPRTKLAWWEDLLSKVQIPGFSDGGELGELVADHSQISAEYVKRWALIGRHSGTRYAGMLAWSQYYDAIPTHPRDLEPRLPEIEAPVLLLFGGVDPIVPAYVGDHFQNALSNSDLVVYEGVSHMIPDIEAPEQSAKDTAEFLGRVKSVRSTKRR